MLTSLECKHGSGLLVNSQLKSQEVNELVFDNLDLVFIVIESRMSEVQVGSKHARLFDEDKFLNLMRFSNAVKVHCSKNQLTSPFILRHFKKTFTAWIDKTVN